MQFFARLAGGTAIATALPAVSWAQEGERYGRYYYTHGPGMMWDGFGGYGMFLGPLFTILLLVALVAAVIYFMRSIGGERGAGERLPAGARSLDILKERYARGEIDSKEFEERKRMLSE